MLNTREADTHCRVLAVLRLRVAKRVSSAYCYSETTALLNSGAFRPRCNCGRVLRVTNWIDGMRAYSCKCGARWRECL